MNILLAAKFFFAVDGDNCIGNKTQYKMPQKTFNKNIKGYWLDKDKSDLPTHSGVYFVYECTYNSKTDKVEIHKLIYIGESGNVNERVSNQEKYGDWKKHVRKGKELCFSTCKEDWYYRERLEAAYIYKHKPPVNTEYKYAFPFDETRVTSSVAAAELNTDFTVHKTQILSR